MKRGAAVGGEADSVAERDVGQGERCARLIEIAEGKVVEQRAPAAALLDRSARHHDAVVGLELNLRFTRNDRIDQMGASRDVPFGRVKDCAAAIRAAGRDHQRLLAGESRIALAELIESEPDRFQKVFAPVLLRVLFRMRRLERDAVRPFGQKFGSRGVVEVGAKMRVAAGFRRRDLSPIEEIRRILLQDVEAVAMPLVGVDDRAAVAEAPVAEVDDVAEQARRAVHRDRDQATTVARQVLRDLEQHRDILFALAVVGVGQVFLAGDLALSRNLLTGRLVNVRAEQAPEPLPSAARLEQGRAAKLRGGRVQRIDVSRPLAEHGVRAESAGDKVVGHAVVSRMRTEAQPWRGGFFGERNGDAQDDAGGREQSSHDCFSQTQTFPRRRAVAHASGPASRQSAKIGSGGQRVRITRRFDAREA